jgi:putative peptidoglycan lipid II flippase
MSRRRVLLASALMIASVGVSRLLGVVRMKVFADAFGANPQTDAYVMAFALPDFVFLLVGGGVISSAFIPYFTERHLAGEEKAGWHTFSALLGVVGGSLTVLLGLLWIFAPHLTPILCGKLDPSVQPLCIRITRIVLFSQVFFFFGGLSMGALNARQHFLTPAVGPMLYNLCIILGIWFLAPRWGIESAAWSALVAAAVSSILLQAIALRRHGAPLRISFDFRDPGVVRVVRFMVPVIFGLCAVYAETIFSKWLATADARTGATTCFENAYRLAMLAVGMFAVGAGVATFPTLADAHARGRTRDFVEHLSLALRTILFLTIPTVAILSALALPVVRLLFEGGAFTPEDSALTTWIFLCFSLGILGLAGQQFFPRAFYAMNDSMTPFLIGLGAVILQALLAIVLFRYFSTAGCALAMSIASTLAFLVMLFELRRRLGRLDGARLLSSTARCLLAGVAAGGTAYGCWVLLRSPAGPTTLAGRAYEALLPAIAGCIIFAALVPILRLEEGLAFWRALRGRLGRGQTAS